MAVESVRTITDVIDVETGELLHIDDYFFRKNEAYLFLLRRRLYEYAYLGIGKPKYLCAVCRQPVVLLGRKTRRGQVVYFAHYKDSDDCPIKTHSGEMSADDIRRTVYFGETEQHLELKHQIYAALQTSHITGVPFSHTKEEQRIGSKLDFRSWAVPDIYAECGELKINFEVQVNSMFLSTIIERDIYYRFHNIFIMWIFSPSAVSNETMGLKDIAWTNNGNVFVYDTIARQRTEASGELTLLCRWYEMDSQNQEKITLNKGKYVTLSDLTFDRETNAVYYEDVASKIVAIYPDFSKDRAEMEQRELEALDEFRVVLDGVTPTKEEVIQGLKSGLYKPRWIKKGNYFGFAKYGHTIVPFIYNHAEDFVDGVAIMRRTRRYGVVNMFGEEIVEPEYTEARQFHEGLAAVQLGGAWGFIDTEGEEVVSNNFSDVLQDFQDGVAVVKRIEGYSSKIIKIDKRGWRIVEQEDGEPLHIPLYYSQFGNLSDGLIAVNYRGKWGFINTEGKRVIDTKYEAVSNFKDGYAEVVLGDCGCKLHGLIDSEGREVIPVRYKRIMQGVQDGVAIVETFEGRSLRVDTQGNLIVRCDEEDICVPVAYCECRDFSEGFAAVKLGGRWGFINLQGEEVIPTQFHNVVEGFKNGYAVIKPSQFALGKVRVNSKGQMVLRNGDEDVVVSNDYEDYRDFSEGLAAVLYDEKWGFINLQGEVVIPFQFDEVVRGFVSGYALVKKSQNSDGSFLINTQGSIMLRSGRELISVPAIYEEYCSFSEGLAAVRRNGKWGFINLPGEEVIAFDYDFVHSFNEGFAFVAKRSHRTRWFSSPSSILWGVINCKGEEIVSLIYDNIQKLNGGRFVALKDNYWGLIEMPADDSHYTWVKYNSLLDIYFKTKQKIDVVVSSVVHNGYECRVIHDTCNKLDKTLFIPHSLAGGRIVRGAEFGVYIVKDPSKSRSSIASPRLQMANFSVGERWQGKIVRDESYGLFVHLNDSDIKSLAHHSTFTADNKRSKYKVGDTVNVEVVSIDQAKKRVNIRIVSLA